MEPLTGGLLAALVAWLSILVAVALPLERVLDPASLRLGAAVALGLLAAMALGAPLPSWFPLAALAVTIAAAASAKVARRRDGA